MYSRARKILASFMAIACAILGGCAQYVETGARLPTNNPSPMTMISENLLATGDVLNIQDTHITYTGSNINVDAQLSIPDGISGISQMEVTYGGAEADFEALRARLTPDVQGAVRDFTASEQFDKTVKANVAERFSPDGNLYLGGLISYAGGLIYRDSLPSELYTENEVAEYGLYSPDGVAQKCAISADTALEWADEIIELSGIEAEVELGAPSVYALSPEPHTRLHCGYYAVYYPLEVNGIPVALSNYLPSDKIVENYNAYIPRFTGFGFQCFDMGVMQFEGNWFDMGNARNLGECEDLISPWQALKMADAAAEDFWVKDRGAEVLVREIRLEYAVVQLDGAFRLVPAWTFDTLEGAALDKLSGIRIDATSGEVLAMELTIR